MSGSDETCRVGQWALRTRSIRFDSFPAIMGIVNVTPDSFSDGGKFLDPAEAIAQAMQLDADGADILDIGGESTRPYSDRVSEAEELDRVIPVISQLSRQTSTPISIDTSKAAVARAAIEAGAEIINDITGLQGDPEMLTAARDSGAGVCAMHIQGTPQTMQDAPTYNIVFQDIFEYLRNRKQHLIEAGIPAGKICLDPGIGFGKTCEHNLELIKNCGRFLALECPILIGHSRKGFIGKATGNRIADPDSGTLAISLLLAQAGIQIVRVHNVLATAQAFRVCMAIENGQSRQ